MGEVEHTSPGVTYTEKTTHLTLSTLLLREDGHPGAGGT